MFEPMMILIQMVFFQRNFSYFLILKSKMKYLDFVMKLENLLKEKLTTTKKWKMKSKTIDFLNVATTPMETWNHLVLPSTLKLCELN